MNIAYEFTIMPAPTDTSERIWKKHLGGGEIKYREMSDEYLQRTIAMLKRGYDYRGGLVQADRISELSFLENEAIRRGLIPREDSWDV